MEKESKTILITGASGFIGSALVSSLRRFGYHVLAPSHRDCDLAEGEGLRKCTEAFPIDTVIHCASLRPKAGLDFDAYYRGNVLTLSRVLDWMKERNIKQLLTFSSINVYGNIRNTVVCEESPCNPVGDYAVSKWKADQLLELKALEQGLNVVNLRLPTVFGQGGAGFVEMCYARALSNEAIELFSMGKLWRNLIYREHLVNTCQRILQQWKSLPGYQLFLLGSKNSLTMEMIARSIVEKTQSRSSINLVDQKAPAEADWLLDLSRARRLLDFKAVPLESMLDFYIESHDRGAQYAL